MTEQQPAAAAWYADPHDATQLRYWDGSQWTEHVAPATAPKAGMSAGIKVLIGVGIAAVSLFVLGILAAIAIPLFLSQRGLAEDAAAKADVATLGKEIATYFVDNSGPPPRVDATGNWYVLSSGAWVVEVPQSANVELGGVTGSGATDWCVWVTNDAGDLAPDGFRYSAAAGLEPGTC